MIPAPPRRLPANRAERRAAGLKGKFLGSQGTHSILRSNAAGWQERLFTRIDRQSARSRRTIRRMRAAGEEVSA